MANVYTHDSDTTSLDGHAEFSDDNLKFEAHLDEIMALVPPLWFLMQVQFEQGIDVG